MAATELTHSIGQQSKNGETVSKIHATQTNDTTHVCTNPDQGRLVMRNAQGWEHTTVSSVTASTSAGVTTLIKETQ